MNLRDEAKLIDSQLVMIFAVIVVACVMFPAALGFMALWNYAVVAAVSVANPIGYWESLGLTTMLWYFAAVFGSASNRMGK